jgi:hypothetical protein
MGRQKIKERPYAQIEPVEGKMEMRIHRLQMGASVCVHYRT